MAHKVWDYILSHHDQEDYNRCFSVKVLGKRCYLCARCSGWYLSFLLFWFLFLLNIDFLIKYSLVILYFFPVPALIDWGLHKLGVWEGKNSTRFASGFLIGFTFAQLTYIFFKNPLNFHFWVVTLTFVSTVAVIWKMKPEGPKAFASRGPGRKSCKSNAKKLVSGGL